MATYFLMVETNCTDPAREKEFNEWYDKVAVPDAAQNPGFVRATRYQLAEPVEGRSKYLAIYEIECADLAAWMAGMVDYMNIKRSEGRLSPLLSTTSRTVYTKISSFPK